MARRDLPTTAPYFDGTQACSGADIDLFFPGQDGNSRLQVQKAKALCAACTFRDPCLTYALTERGAGGVSLYGVWGGTTFAERQQLRRAGRRAA